jgi:type I restriction enzyme S subunit
LVRLYELICKRVDNRGKTPVHVSVKSEHDYIDLLEINAIVPGASIDHQKVEKFIDEETYSSLRGYVEEGDILIATVGSVGKFAIMDSSKSAIAQNIIGIRCFDDVDQKYIFYLLQSPYFYESMGSIKMEAVQASIKVPDLMNLFVPLPPLAEQKRIVAKLENLLPQYRITILIIR